MSDPAAGPAGPDLRQGVAASDVADGGILLGHLGDDAVILVRKGEQFFALDAFCTHYHGPLAEGAIRGDTIVCPWHHACFDLRTGSAACAPALRPLCAYPVVRTGEVVRVDAAPQHIAILGAGAAGAFAARELRRLGFEGRITLLSRDERLPFDKPNLSKDYLAGRAPQEWIPLRERADYEADRIDLRLGTTVEAIDTAGSSLRLAGGEQLPFDRLILATGATPRRLAIPVDPDARVHYLRTWSDADALAAAAGTAREVAILGSSFIGLEVAASLRERGLDVTVIAPEERPLERVLGSAIGDFIRGLHEQHGVRFRLGRTPAEVRAREVVLDDGSSQPCDFVVAGIGVEPELALARGAGLAVDNGIVVDEFLQTSAPNVFAAGDVARYPYGGSRIRVEHWVAAGRQGQAAARNALGRREPFASVPFFWSQHYDLVFAYVGHAGRADDVLLFGSLESTNAAALYRENGRITAAVTLFRDDVSLAVEAAMQRGAESAEIEALVRAAF